MKVCVAPSNVNALEASSGADRTVGIVAAKVTKHSATVVLVVPGVIVQVVGIVYSASVRVNITSATGVYTTVIYGTSQGSFIRRLMVSATSVIALPERDWGVITIACYPAILVSSVLGTVRMLKVPSHVTCSAVLAGAVLITAGISAV